MHDFVRPLTLVQHGVRLEPLEAAHAPGLHAAVEDGALWRIRLTSAPEPQQVENYGWSAKPRAPRTSAHFGGLASASKSSPGRCPRCGLRLAIHPKPQCPLSAAGFADHPYIATALEQRARGQRFAFAVLEDASGRVLGTSSYHDSCPPCTGWSFTQNNS